MPHRIAKGTHYIRIKGCKIYISYCLVGLRYIPQCQSIGTASIQGLPGLKGFWCIKAGKESSNMRIRLFEFGPLMLHITFPFKPLVTCKDSKLSWNSWYISPKVFWVTTHMAWGTKHHLQPWKKQPLYSNTVSTPSISVYTST